MSRLARSITPIQASLSAHRLTTLAAHLRPATRRTMSSTTLPKTMSGVSIAKNGGVDVLEYKTDLAVPEPGEGQVIVENDVLGINYIDTYLFPLPPTSHTKH